MRLCLRCLEWDQDETRSLNLKWTNEWRREQNNFTPSDGGGGNESDGVGRGKKWQTNGEVFRMRMEKPLVEWNLRNSPSRETEYFRLKTSRRIPWASRMLWQSLMRENCFKLLFLLLLSCASLFPTWQPQEFQHCSLIYRLCGSQYRLDWF